MDPGFGFYTLVSMVDPGAHAPAEDSRSRRVTRSRTGSVESKGPWVEPSVVERTCLGRLVRVFAGQKWMLVTDFLAQHEIIES